MAQVWRIPEPPAVMYYHGLWIVADACERSGPIEDYNAAQWITTNCAKPLTTPRRYGKDMAHSEPPSARCYPGIWVVADDRIRILCITMDYMDYHG